MSVDRRLALSPMGKAPVVFAVVLGAAVPVGIAIALTVMVTHGQLDPLVMLATQGLLALGCLAMVLPLWRREASFDGQHLRVKAAYYTRQSPLSDFDLDQAVVVDVREHGTYKPLVKTNGVGMPGYWAGHFRLRDRRKAFCLVTDAAKVLVLPHADGTQWLLGLEHPQAVLDILRRSKR